MKNLLSIGALALFASVGMGQITPSLTETSGVNTAFRNAPRAYASYIDESQLSSVAVPTVITGFRLRIMATSLGAFAGTSWPSQTLNFADYSVKIGQANATVAAANEIPSLVSFDSLFAGDVVTARSGSLSLNTGDFPINQLSTPSNPNGWGPEISFTTPYTYTPGNTLIYAISHTGYTPSTEAQPFFAVASFANGVADAVSSTSSNSFSGVAGGFSSPYVIQFTTAPVPEPASMIAMGVGLSALVARRRRKF